MLLHELATTVQEEVNMHRITGLPRLAHIKNDYEKRAASGKAPAFIVLSPAELGDVPLDEGDNLLREARDRIEEAISGLRDQKSVVIGQIGGRFTITLDYQQSEKVLKDLIDTICHVFHRPLSLGTQVIVPTVHMGISQWGNTDKCFDQAQQEANTAHRAAVRRQCRYLFYAAAFEEEALELHAVTRGIKWSIDSKHVEGRYMEIRRLETLEVCGYEHLARIADPINQRVIDAEQWVSVAEKTRLIVPLGSLANTQAVAGFKVQCQKTALLEKESGRNFDIDRAYLALNFHSHQLREPGSAERLSTLLSRCQIPAKRVVVEVTETGDLLRPDTQAVIQEISALGCRIFLDDFCKEYSSLPALDRLPLSGLKIDKVYLQKLEENPVLAERLMRAMIEIAQAIGVETIIAEGVETEQQVQFLKSIGIQYGQGYYFRKRLLETYI